MCVITSDCNALVDDVLARSGLNPEQYASATYRLRLFGFMLEKTQQNLRWKGIGDVSRR
jgi:hypothetical protein